jgi:hypothetical protein
LLAALVALGQRSAPEVAAVVERGRQATAATPPREPQEQPAQVVALVLAGPALLAQVSWVTPLAVVVVVVVVQRPLPVRGRQERVAK